MLSVPPCSRTGDCLGRWHLGHNNPVTSFSFRPIECRIPGLKQFFLTRPLVWKRSNPNGGCDYSERSPVIHNDEIPQFFPNPLRSCFGGTQVGCRKDNHEFLSAIAADKIFSANAPYQQ